VSLEVTPRLYILTSLTSAIPQHTVYVRFIETTVITDCLEILYTVSARLGYLRNEYRSSVGKFEVKEVAGRRCCKWECSVKIMVCLNGM
jgi:hypothetical protein